VIWFDTIFMPVKEAFQEHPKTQKSRNIIPAFCYLFFDRNVS
jgi:hypothetical protein